MDLDVMNLFESLFRWIHVVAGILWIGFLYFFNWVNANFAPTLDADSKKKVVPELMPRALYFFRWGAAYTWLTGVILATMVYYHTKVVLANPQDGWSAMAGVMIALTFLGVFAYDVLMKAVKEIKVQFAAGWVLASGVAMLFLHVGHFSFRGASIHLGMLFGTIMAFNVWFRIWPAQRKIIAAVQAGTPPDAALVALAGLRSRHNTYLSVPLVFTMVAQHGTWASSLHGVFLPVIVLIGWLAVMALYNKSKTDPVKAY